MIANLQPSNTKNNFRFSRKLKYKEADIEDQGILAKINNYYYGLVLLEPCLSISSPSRLTLRVNRLGSVCMGVCLKDIIVQHDYQFLGNDHGAYMMDNLSEVYSHCNPDNDGQKIGFEFKKDDIVTVEVNPEAGRILYSLTTGQRYQQPLKQEHLQLGPLHFGVYLRGAEVNVIDT